MRRRLLDDEGGWALVTAVVLLSVMMGIGLATYAFADGQQGRSRGEKVRESSFNLSEAALNAQVFQLTAGWPNAATPELANCTGASLATTACPSAQSIATGYSGGDYAPRTCPGGTPDGGWRTTVHDTASLPAGGPDPYYNATTVEARPTYDQNRDGAMWVRAEGTAQCRRRVVVAMVKRQQVAQPFPRNAITANSFATSNSGRKVIVDTLGAYAQPPIPGINNAQSAAVSVRCSGYTTRSSCLQYDTTKGQVSPDTTKQENTPLPTISPAIMEDFRQQAKAANTFYAAGTCPPNLSGVQMSPGAPPNPVYVEDMTPCGGYNNGGNSKPGTSPGPGILIVERGGLTLGGNGVFYGVVYLANKGMLADAALLKIRGTAAVQGAIVVDGPAGVSAGSSKTNVVYDNRVFDAVRSSGSVVVAPNTWRELPNGG